MYPKNFVIKRILLSIGLGLFIGALISEVPFLFLSNSTRAPREIVLTIPVGTAEKVARGEQPPSIPKNMTFVVGDTLMVKNDDLVDHKLGPLWIPSHSSAQLSLDQEENFAYECSFQPGNYFGLDVQEPLTSSTRIYGILYVAFPLSILIALYSLLIPPRKKQNVAA
jgi:hypothetical protein